MEAMEFQRFLKDCPLGDKEKGGRKGDSVVMRGACSQAIEMIKPPYRMPLPRMEINKILPKSMSVDEIS